MPRFPISRTIHTLPFDSLSPRDFERLCLWLVESEGYERAERLGVAGSEESHGIVAWRQDRLWAFQCRRAQRFGLEDALAEVEKVLTLPGDQRPAVLVFLVPCDVSANTRRQVRARCGGGMACHFWAGAELDARVKRHPDIVAEFFQAAVPFIPAPVPAPPAHFTGRGAELAALAQALTTDDTPQAITAPPGLGGVGKTALAAQLAAQLDADLPGGVFWADLLADGGDPLPVLAAWARLCGHDVSRLPDPRDRARAVRGALAQRVAERGRLLVVLDDVRGRWLDGARVLQSARPSGVPLLLTTRDEASALALGATVCRLDVLPLGQALELLATLAGPAVERELDAARRLAEQVDCLPLALELTGKLAALRARRPGFRLASLCEDVETRTTGPLPLKAQRGLVACFCLSYETLDTEEQRLFRALGAFASAPLAAEHVAAVVGREMGRVEAGLDALAARSLGRWEGEGEKGGAALRYRLHPLLREYAAALLEEAGEEQAMRAFYISHYLAYARAHSQPTPAAYDGLEAERPNILAAMDRAYWEERWGQVRGFAWALCKPASGYLDVRGYRGERRVRLEQAIRASEAEGNKRDAVAFIKNLAALVRNTGQVAEARRLYRQGLDMEEELGDWAGIAISLGQLANLAKAQGDLVEAQRLYRRSLNIFEELQARQKMAVVYRQLGNLAYLTEEHAQARRFYGHSLDIAEELGDQSGMAEVLHQLGMLAQKEGHVNEARRLYRRSLDINEKLEDRAGMAVTLHELGNLACLRGEYTEARRLYRQSLDIEEELGNQAGMAVTLHQLGIVAHKAGHVAEARRLYRRSLDIEEELENRAGIAKSLHELGNLACVTEEYAEARRLYQGSLDIAEELGDRAGIASTLGQLGNLAYLRGAYAEARRLYWQSLDVNQELGNRAGIAVALHQLGNLAYLSGEYAEARHLYQGSLDIAEELGDREGIASTLGQLAHLARAEGDLPKAERLYRQSLTMCQELGDVVTERTTLSNLALLYEDQGRLAEALPLLERAVQIGERVGLPTLEQDRRVLEQVHLQMQPGCTGWIARRAVALGRALDRMRGELEH